MNKDFFKKTSVVCLIAMICCFLWGSAFPCIKIGYSLLNISSGEYASQILFAGVRFTLAGIMVILFNSVTEKKFIKPKDPAYICIISLFQTVLQYVFFYIGMANTTGVKGSIITSAGVFLTILVSCIIFKQDVLTGAKIVGTLIGFAGVVLINMEDGIGGTSVSFVGEGFVLIAALSSAFSSSYMKEFSKKTDVVMVSGYQFFFGGLVMALIGYGMGGRFVISGIESVLILLYMAFISAAAYTLWSILLKHNSVSRVSIYKFMNPLFGAVLSTIILTGEGGLFQWKTLFALVLVCLGIVTVNKEKKADDE